MTDPIVYAINHNGLNHEGRPLVETVDTTTMDPIVYALRYNAAREASKTLGDPGTPGRRY